MGEIYKVLLSFEVELELDLVEQYYEGQSPGLGDAFLRDFNRALQRLSRFRSFQIRYADIRILQMDRFPYTLHFSVDDESQTVLVEGLYHEKQDVLPGFGN